MKITIKDHKKAKPVTSLEEGTFFVRTNYIQDDYTLYQIPHAPDALNTHYTIRVFAIKTCNSGVISMAVFRCDEEVLPVKILDMSVEIEFVDG